MDFACDVSTLRNQGLEVHLKVNQLGYYVLSVVAFGDEPRRSGRGPKLAASYFERAFVRKRPDLSDVGLYSSLTEDGLYRFVPLRTSPVCGAVTLGGARDECPSDPKKIITKLHVNWGACIGAAAQGGFCGFG